MFIQKHSNANYYLYFFDIVTEKRKKVSLKTSDSKKAKKLLRKYETFPNLIYSELIEEKQKVNEPPLILTIDELAKLLKGKTLLHNCIRDYLLHSEKNHTNKTQKAIQQTFKFLCVYLSGTDFQTLSKLSLVDCLGLIPTYEVDKLTKLEVEKYFSVRIDESGIYQVRKDKINLSGFFTFLVNKGVITENHCSKIKLPKIPQKLPLFISETEFQILLANTENEVLRDIFNVGYYTGMRLNEIVTLRFSMLDFKERVIKLDNQHEITKSKKFRIIPMNETVFSVLSKLKDTVKGDFVFYNSLPQTDKSDFVSKQFKKIVRGTSLDKRFHFHNLRDSFATNLNIKGVSVTVIQKLLGHSNVTTTMIYTHTNDTQLKDAINVL